jgi:hypothetical protein
MAPQKGLSSVSKYVSMYLRVKGLEVEIWVCVFKRLRHVGSVISKEIMKENSL